MTALCAVLTKFTICQCRKYGWLGFVTSVFPPSLSPRRCGPTRARVSSFRRFVDHAQQRATVVRTLLDEWSLVADTSSKQHGTQQTDINASAGIRTHNLSRRAAADLRHWDRLVTPLTKFKYDIYLDCQFANFPTVLVATFLTLVVKLTDTLVVVMVTRTHRKCYALLVFPNLLLTHYDQIGSTAISNLDVWFASTVSGILSLCLLCGSSIGLYGF
jgi:hypothetical protein